MPQFPGAPPRSVRKVKNSGFAIGSDNVLSQNLINSFRYGLTRIDDAKIGVTNSQYVTFRFIAPFEGYGDANRHVHDHPENPDPQPRERSVVAQGHAHVQVRHEYSLHANPAHAPITAPSIRRKSIRHGLAVWDGRYAPGRSTCTTPGCSQVPAVATGFQAGYADAWLNVLGVISQATLNANYSPTGEPLPTGQPVARKYASDEYEFYVQDSWQLHPTFTVTAGVRYSLLSPPWEVNGFQVAPTVNIGEWFEGRRRSAEQGIPSSRDPRVQFDLAGPGNDRPHFYEWDLNNFAPRVAVAWTPEADSGFLGALAGNGRMVIRGGTRRCSTALVMAWPRSSTRPARTEWRHA